MIQEYVDRFMAAEPEIRGRLGEKHPGSYDDLVKLVIDTLAGDYRDPDPERIHRIDDGAYQGTLVYVIGEHGYQPYDYWWVKVGYGSCSGCDTLEAIRSYNWTETPTPENVNEYWTLCLHIVQGLHLMQ